MSRRHIAARRDRYAGGKKRRQDEVALRLQKGWHATHGDATPPVIEIDTDANPEAVRIREPDR